MIPDYKDLPYGIRKNPEKRWNYLAKLLNEQLFGSEVESSEPSLFNIQGTITDGENPIGGAEVIIEGVTKKTGKAGGCKFNDVPEGEHVVNVHAEGYEDFVNTFIIDDEHTSFKIALHPEV